MNNDSLLQEATAAGLQASAELVEEDPKVARKVFRLVAEANSPFCPSCHKPVKHREGLAWCQDRQMSEKSLQARIVRRAKKLGWVVKHVGKGIASVVDGQAVYVSTAVSFPDLFLLNERQQRPLAIECKTETGDFEPGQLEYLRLLNICGIPAVAIRPSDWREGRVDAILGPQ